MTLGEKIQQLRKASGVSQEQLAEQLDVSRQSISKWELNDSVPDISKIVMLSELFAISTDELLKDSCTTQSAEFDNNKRNTLTLEEITRLNLAHKQIIMGFRTVVIGFIMLVLEFMFLPIFGTMQKAHVNGQEFYSDFMKYAGMQPMPTIFMLTTILIIVGVCFLLKGYFYKNHDQVK